MSYIEKIKERYDATPFTAWFDRYCEGQMHLGVWPNGSEDRGFAEAAKRLTGLLIEKLDVKKNHRVLDAGCGVYAGPAIHLAGEKDCDVVGITLEDHAEQIVPERAASKGVSDKVRVQVGNAAQLPFSDESFDRAWMIEMLVHVPEKEKVLGEVFRVLRPGGKIAIADFPSDEKPTTENEWIEANHFVISSYDEFEKMLKEIGFPRITAEDYNDTVAVPTFEKILEHVREKPDETKSIVGDEMYDIFLDVLPKGIEAHKNRILSYGIFTAQKPYN